MPDNIKRSPDEPEIKAILTGLCRQGKKDYCKRNPDGGYSNYAANAELQRLGMSRGTATRLLKEAAADGLIPYGEPAAKAEEPPTEAKQAAPATEPVQMIPARTKGVTFSTKTMSNREMIRPRLLLLASAKDNHLAGISLLHPRAERREPPRLDATTLNTIASGCSRRIRQRP